MRISCSRVDPCYTLLTVLVYELWTTQATQDATIHHICSRCLTPSCKGNNILEGKQAHTMRMLPPTPYLGWCNSRTFTCLSTPQHKPYTSHHTVAPPGQPHHLNTTCNAWTWTSCTPLHLGHIKGYQHGTGHRVPALCSTRAMEQSTILIPIPQLRSAQMQEDTCETS